MWLIRVGVVVLLKPLNLVEVKKRARQAAAREAQRRNEAAMADQRASDTTEARRRVARAAPARRTADTHARLRNIGLIR